MAIFGCDLPTVIYGEVLHMGSLAGVTHRGWGIVHEEERNIEGLFIRGGKRS